MAEKPEISNLCPEEIQTDEVDVIWPNSSYHETLPVIGSCQVSSILSTFEEPKLQEVQDNNFKSIPINIINPEPDIKRKNIFKEMMYFGCNLCPFICTKDSKISDHIQNVHKTKSSNKKSQLKCPGCANIFYHKLSLRSHLIYDHEVGRNDINKIVNSVYLQNNNNQEKMDYVEVEMSYEDFVETDEETLPKEEEVGKIEEVEDVSKEEKKKNQKCYVSTCAVRMTEITNMSYHVKCHFGKIFRCLECSANFVTWKTLQTHLWRVHSIDMELYSCDKCNYKTYSLAKLNNIHKLIHGTEKSFLCDFCGKGFKNPKQLRNHKIVHKAKLSNKLLVECDICKSSFNDKRILKIHHQSVHQKLKPFSCNYCSYKAASNGDLKLHVRLHTGQKPFSCDQCDYSTADHNSLRKHKSRHTNEKKYKCAHCDYACIQSSTYKTHLKTKHPGLENDLIFSCTLCQFRSVNKNKYLNHLTSHKDDESEVVAADQKMILPKKTTPTTTLDLPPLEVLQTPVVLSKLETVSNCIILPVDTTSNSLQYFYNTSDVVLEIIDEKPK